MHNLVEFAFTMVAYALVASIFYAIFFGASFITMDGEEFEGILMYGSRATQTSTAYFYYKYMYTPTIHGTDDLDKEVVSACGFSGSSIKGVVSDETESNLNLVTDNENMGNALYGVNTSNNYYTTSWH